jgi:hypothetical protein
LLSRNKTLLQALIKAFGKEYIPLAIWKLLATAFYWVGIYFCLFGYLSHKESQVVDTSLDNTVSHLYALGIFLCSLFGSLCFYQHVIKAAKVGIEVSWFLSLVSCCIDGYNL